MNTSKAPQTILFLAANPKGTDPLRLDQELRDIGEGLQRAQKRDQFNLAQRSAVRPRDIQRAMNDLRPQIVHFSGHGTGDAGLVFEDEIGNAKMVDGDALAALFGLFADRLNCVVLNGCYSEVQAQAISQYIPYVIGMNKAIGDKAAIAFAVGFYDALGAGRDVEFAFKSGCVAVRLEGIAEHLTPILIKKPIAPGDALQIHQNSQLVQRKFDSLVEILQFSEALWEKIQQIYQNTILHWPTKVKTNVDDVRSVVTELNKIAQGSLSYTALNEFIANLFNEISDVVMNNNLAQWGQEYCQDMDWLSLYVQIQESQDKRLKNAQPAILIAIARSDEASTQSPDGETYYQLESWLIEDIETYKAKKTGFYSLLIADSSETAPCLLDELLENITSWLERFLQQQRNHCQGCENYPQIHVFLPLELIHLGVDVWLLENSKRTKYLGHDYLVFIRCANRYDRNYSKAPTWKKLWKRHQDLLQEAAQNVFVPGHDKDLDKLIEVLDDAVQDDRPFVGLQITDAPVDPENLVYELLDSGLPLAIWSRSDLAESEHRTQVSKLLADCCLEALPSSVKAKRFETRQSKNTKVKHIGHHLSFLWDDPNFYPPKSA
jgi:vWA-MoxR associated protein C-terminal domain/CHAT domain